MSKHIELTPQRCDTCGMMMESYIPHECDPSICKMCNGTKVRYVGRKFDAWVGVVPCQFCNETGKTQWGDGRSEGGTGGSGPDEPNPIPIPV